MRTATEWTLKSMRRGSARKSHLQCYPISILKYYKNIPDKNIVSVDYTEIKAKRQTLNMTKNIKTQIND
jgi:hypothetical protein